jgi:MFS family permease
VIGKTERLTTTMAAQKSVGTFDALRNRNFRVYFLGQLASTSGTWMQLTAQGWLVFQLTHSEAWLGVVACAAGLPILLLSPLAGVIVERVSRQRIMLITQTLQMLLAFILAALVFTSAVQTWHIVVLALLLGVTNAVDGTARFAIIADLVEREHLKGAITLNSILFNASRVLGPGAAGLALATLGAGWCFFLNGLSFLPVLVSLFLVTVKPVVAPTTITSPLQQLNEGWRYARSHRLILPALLLAATMGLLGLAVFTLLPAYAAVVLNSPTSAYTAMSVINGLGGVVAGFALGQMMRRVGMARLVGTSALLSAVSIGLIGITTTVAPAAFVQFIFGFTAVTLFAGATALIQIEVSNEFRGRVMALYNLAFSGLTPFGALALGLISANIGISNTFILTAVVIGLVSLAILVRWSTLWQRQPIAITPLVPMLAEEQA